MRSRVRADRLRRVTALSAAETLRFLLLRDWVNNAATRRKAPSVAGDERVTSTRRRALTDADSGSTVLLVDDSEDNRLLYAEHLETFGIRVLHAADGEHALFKAARNVPDVVVMDLAMPILDGWEALRHLKAGARTKHVPVIVLTGRVVEDGLRRAHELGAYAVLTKPCLPEVLLSIIRGILDRADRGSA
jgi:CheY-like chemotaxis protein